jgi:predicted RNA-binding Zn-ribbon protein involved in translation (DUF1610 family)
MAGTKRKGNKRCTSCGGGIQDRAWTNEDGASTTNWILTEGGARPVWLCRNCGSTERRIIRVSAQQRRRSALLARLLAEGSV